MSLLENLAMILFQPAGIGSRKPWVRLFNAKDEARISEADYFRLLREVYNRRNPHAPVGKQGEGDVE